MISTFQLPASGHWVWRGPEWLRPAVGGLVLGGVLLMLPQMYSVGYPVMESAVHGQYVLWFLLVLLIGKLFAASLTIGIGGSGGVFAPSLFIGATAGTAFGLAVNTWLPGLTGAAGIYGLLGMGAAFAGAARAPITAVIVLVEITGNYSMILPLMTAVVVATLISRAISTDTVYTSKLRRRGVSLETPQQPEGPTARAVAEELGDEQSHILRVGELARLPPVLTENATLTDALTALSRSEGTGLPVLTSERVPSGWITHQAVCVRSNRPRRAETSRDQTQQ